MRFEVATADYRSSGSYVVEGEAYSLELGDAEVFCDGKVRYEVDNGRREVTILDVDRRSRNILNNPVRAFDFIGSDYSCELLWERDGQAAVRLTPMAGSDSSAGEITLVVDTSRMRPVSLSYDYDGERVDVAIRSVGAPDAPAAALRPEGLRGLRVHRFPVIPNLFPPRIGCLEGGVCRLF